MNIFYESMTYNYIAEAPVMNADMLFSNIGGFLGLCMGTSILFAVEVLELCITTYGIIRTHKNENKILNEMN
jgi:hypothetical protein